MRRRRATRIRRIRMRMTRTRRWTTGKPQLEDNKRMRKRTTRKRTMRKRTSSLCYHPPCVIILLVLSSSLSLSSS